MPKIFKSHLIFDVDDTLADSHAFNQQMFVDTFASYLDLSVPETEKHLRDVHFSRKGTSMLAQFTEVITHFSLSLDPVQLVQENERLHLKHVDQIRLFPAAVDLVKAITAQGRQVSICTNRQTQSVTKILKNHHIYDCFTHVVSCAEVGHEKPDPFCLLDIIAKSGRPKTDFIYFGDSQTDFHFAKNAGIDFMIVDHYLNQKLFYKILMQSFL
jgi:HAD superfamily hydrolase (TIGR01549 family)